MRPTAYPSTSTTTRALTSWSFIVSATSSAEVSGVQVMTPRGIHSRTFTSSPIWLPGSPIRRAPGSHGRLGHHDLSGNLQHFLVASPHRGHVVLDHLLPALAEGLPERPLHRLEHGLHAQAARLPER